MLKKMMTLKIQKYPRFTKISQILEMSCVYIGSTCDTLSKCMSNFRIKSKSRVNWSYDKFYIYFKIELHEN